MAVVFVVSRNLFDTSQIKESFRDGDDLEYISCSKLSQFIEKLDAHSGKVKALVDYTLFDHPDDIIELQANLDDDVHVIMFGPHELMAELSLLYPNIEFVARSKFFRQPSLYVR